MSVMVAVKVIVLPITTEDGFGETVVLVVRKLTVKPDVPTLPVCVESPE